jgi:transposase
MISPELEAKIVRLYHAERWPVGTIATQLSVHHTTVRRALAHAGEVDVARLTRPSRLDAFIPLIKRALEDYPTLRASRLYEMAKGRGYVGGPDHFRHMVALYRPRRAGEAYLRLRTLPGEQAQVDWGHFGHLTIGRAKRPLMAFVMVLSWSRAVFLRFYLDARMANFLGGHQAAFEAWGGVPRILLYDNLKSAVLERTRDVMRFNPTLVDFSKHHRFDVRPVAVARGNEKGRVERAIQYIRHSFFAARMFADVADLNAQADAWCKDIADMRPCPEDKTLTVAQALAQETPRLLPLPENPFPVEEVESVTVGKAPYVRYDLNDYSVPHVHVRKALTVRASTTQVRILDGQNVIAVHQRSYNKAEQVESQEHIAALMASKRQAREQRGVDRLARAVPQSQELLRAVVATNGSISQATGALVRLLDDYGAAELEEAIRCAVDEGVLHPHAVRQICEQRAQNRNAVPVLPVPLPDDPRVREAMVKPHNLASYDTVAASKDSSDA